MVNHLPRFLRRWVRRLRDLSLRFQEWPLQRQTLGRQAARQLGWSAFAWPIGDPRDPPGPVASIMLPGLLHPFWFRHGTSDVLAIKQLFVRMEYRRLQELKEIKTILDVGANIGAASVMFLTIFPQARVIAIEPAPGNAEVLRRNLDRYGQQAMVIEAAIWPREESLELAPNRYRDKLDWSNQVQPTTGPSSLATVTMDQILQKAGVNNIDLLKIDIEGAELALFEGNTDWLKRVKNLCIEVHSEEAQKRIDEALSPFCYEKVVEDETTYYLGLEIKAATSNN